MIAGCSDDLLVEGIDIILMLFGRVRGQSSELCCLALPHLPPIIMQYFRTFPCRSKRASYEGAHQTNQTVEIAGSPLRCIPSNSTSTYVSCPRHKFYLGMNIILLTPSYLFRLNFLTIDEVVPPARIGSTASRPIKVLVCVIEASNTRAFLGQWRTMVSRK
jgi:hypothetical protein